MNLCLNYKDFKKFNPINYNISQNVVKIMRNSDYESNRLPLTNLIHAYYVVILLCLVNSGGSIREVMLA